MVGQQVSKHNLTGSTTTVHHHYLTVSATRVSFTMKLTVLWPVLSRNPLWYAGLDG